MSKRIISFSLWGSDPKYCIGAEENIRLQRLIYPGWMCRFYVDKTVPDETIQNLQRNGAEIVLKNNSDFYEGLFWRFEPAFDATVERFIVRDCDSRLNVREADAVQEWVDSGFPFHTMRDHKGHDTIVLGAMWGAKSFFIHDFRDLFYWFLGQIGKNPKEHSDHIFLNQVIWPKIHDKALVHDDLKRYTGTERSFRIKLPDGQFVGQQWGADNKPLVVPI